MTTKKRNSAPRKRSEIARQLLELCASAKNWNEYELKVQFSKFLREGEKKRFARAFDRFLKSESNYTRTREGNRQPIKGKIIEFLRSHHLKVADDFLDPVAQQDDENAHLLRSFVKRNAAHNHAIRQAIGSYIVCYELSNVHLNKSDAMHFGYGRLDILYNLGVDAFQFTYRKEESALGYTDFEYKGYAICNSNQIFLLGFEQLVGTDCILLILALEGTSGDRARVTRGIMFGQITEAALHDNAEGAGSAKEIIDFAFARPFGLNRLDERVSSTDQEERKRASRDAWLKVEDRRTGAPAKFEVLLQRRPAAE